jgi:hypothetical protein
MSSKASVIDRRSERRFAESAADSNAGVTASDRRGFERVGTDLLVNRFLNGHPYMCLMTDISRTGARLVPLLEPKAVAPQRFMGIQFQLPGQKEILTASGETMSAGDSVGVRFTNLPPESAWAIEAFLKAA